jgi:deoxyribonuclease-4
MPLLGAHMSIAGGFDRAVERAAAAGCDVVQLFTKSTGQWRARPIEPDEGVRFQEALARWGIRHPLVHASYLINLASPQPALRKRSVAALVEELARADALGIPYVVVHPGAHLQASLEEGLTLVAESLRQVHRQRATGQAEVLLELTAGQGTCLGHRLEHLAVILQQLDEPQRVGVCVDTCHAFAAGYDLADPGGYRAFWQRFEQLLGLARLRAIHLNDSQRELGSRIDRHAHIGHGLLGTAAFRRVLTDPRLAPVPMYLETPKGTHHGEDWDVINLRTLRALADGRAMAEAASPAAGRVPSDARAAPRKGRRKQRRSADGHRREE